VDLPKTYQLDDHWGCALTEIAMSTHTEQKTDHLYVCSDLIKESYVKDTFLQTTGIQPIASYKYPHSIQAPVTDWRVVGVENSNSSVDGWLIFPPPPANTVIQSRQWIEYRLLNQIIEYATLDFVVLPQSAGYVDVSLERIIRTRLCHGRLLETAIHLRKQGVAVV
jgi:hypothetical protein